MPSCCPCHSRSKTSPLVVAAGILLIALLLCQAARLGGREGFAGQKAHEVYSKARDLFDSTKGGATYSEYKTRVPGADPVVFSDVRNLWRDGRLSPDSVQRAL